MDLREFYLQNIQKNEYYYCFYNEIYNYKNILSIFDEPGETRDSDFEIYDVEEAITKFRDLCQPENSYFNDEMTCWFYLISYYLYKMGYEIKEFPHLLSKPPKNPRDFTYGQIRRKIISQHDDNDGKVGYSIMRKYVEGLTFEQTSKQIDESIGKRFMEISNRQASFNSMSTDEQLESIANLIENMLKIKEKYIEPDYTQICFEYISNESVKRYRSMLNCFRHAAESSIEERNSFTADQKNFLVDYGLIIIKAIDCLKKQGNIEE